ncbi:hypothetical protein BHM03_00000833 [Ensete ventricosum]|nr:hypothetical protein BHM03_00000833 [Ensete ventricosum]
MIRSCWELHFGEQCNNKKGYGLKWVMPWYRRGGSSNCWEDTVVLKQVVERGEKATMSPVGLSYPKAKCRLEMRWTRRSTTVLQRRIYRSRMKGCRCKATDSRAMGLTAPWYRRGGTFVGH